MIGITPWIARGAGLALGASLVIGALAVAWAAGSVLLLIFIAVILASGLQPIVAWIRTHVPIGRGAAILVVYGAFLLVVVGMAVVVLPAAVGQLERVIASLPPFIERAREWAADLRPVALSDAMTKVVDAAARTILPSDPSPDGEVVVQVGIGVVGAIISVLTVLTVVYFWLTEHARLQRYALAFIPQHRRARARDIWNQAETRLGMWVRGQLILMGAIGVATGIAYTVLGVPAAVLLGLAAAIAEAIPIVGPLLGAIPAVLVAAPLSPELAVTVAIVDAILQFVEGTVLVPIVMRNTVGISPFLVIFSVLAGAAAGGFIGALLAVPIAATAEILLEGLQAREVPVAQDPTAGEATVAEAAEASAGNTPGEPDVQLGDVVADSGAPPR
ncbi:MAG TPA: AI-2E family transporter [Candidatus Limnocylindrales bacterium]|nr:AI-2E family transporter [Candidatus Limnocylindrales bacterium]